MMAARLLFPSSVVVSIVLLTAAWYTTDLLTLQHAMVSLWQSFIARQERFLTYALLRNLVHPQTSPAQAVGCFGLAFATVYLISRIWQVSTLPFLFMVWAYGDADKSYGYLFAIVLAMSWIMT